MNRQRLFSGLAGLATLVLAPALGASAALADDQTSPSSSSTPSSASTQSSSAPGQPAAVSEIVVTAQRLDAARDKIQPQLGASAYAMSQQSIEALPAGEDTPLNQVILQAPGVAQDSYGQLHIRGEHNGLQFRLNGVILPEGLSVFSQALSPRLASNVELITGALPAEYGLRTAGIVDITTQSGAQPGGSITLYGGSHQDFEPSFEARGGSGNFSYFVSGGYVRNDLGIESPDGRSDPLHDQTRQFQGFAYLEDILSADTRLSMILGTSDQRFQIPDVSGEVNGGITAAGAPLEVGDQTDFPSDRLNENQSENTQYGVVSLLNTTGALTTETSLFTRYSTLSFTPDPLGDLLYDGISQAASKTDTAGGLQVDGAYKLSDAHTLRGGVLVEVDRTTSDTTSQVLLLDATTGAQLSGTPYTIVDNGAKTAETYSAYLQDEWNLSDDVTLNYGLRFDQFDGFRDENQLSPRINLVWQASSATTIHAGYARYFSPPPFELIAGETVQKFTQPIAGEPNVTSTAAPSVTADTTPYAERANYFDVGAEQKLTRALTVTIDGYYKLSNHLIDEGQFGAPIILTPFNYQDGRQYGVELTGSYAKGPFTAYANFAYSVAQGRDWISSQFNFTQPALDYVANHWVYLDHDERVAISAGASYLWRGTRFGGDLIYGSGLRADLPLSVAIATPGGSLTAIPNGEELPGYAQLNLSIGHRFEDVGGKPLEVRFDIINALDAVYQIRNGSGIGVFAPQYGPRRGLFLSVTKDF